MLKDMWKILFTERVKALQIDGTFENVRIEIKYDFIKSN